MEKLAKEISKLSIEAKKEARLKEYKISIHGLKKERDLFLPVPEDFKNKFSTSDLKDYIQFDYDKYCSFFKDDFVLDLTPIEEICNDKMARKLLTFIGGNNEKNDITDFATSHDWKYGAPSKAWEFQECPTFTEYISNNRELIIYDMVITELKEFYEGLKKLGITILPKEESIYYGTLRKHVFESNKINVILAGAGNFWFKHPEPKIGEVGNDLRLNNKSYIYINGEFIELFLRKVVRHPRCNFALISSMVKKNVTNVLTSIKTFLNLEEKPKCYDQSSHEQIGKEASGKPIFARSLKILNQRDKEINELNTIFLESDLEKIHPEIEGCDIRGNEVHLKLFNPHVVDISEDEKKALKEKQERIINFLLDIFENCTVDIRSYIQKHRADLSDDVFDNRE
ncbi:MAG: hypothetical protein MJ252_30855 [archaeon]|nr:hypothetical protein [archaeon]